MFQSAPGPTRSVVIKTQHFLCQRFEREYSILSPNLLVEAFYDIQIRSKLIENTHPNEDTCSPCKCIAISMKCMLCILSLYFFVTGWDTGEASLPSPLSLLFALGPITVSDGTFHLTWGIYKQKYIHTWTVALIQSQAVKILQADEYMMKLGTYDKLATWQRADETVRQTW